MLGTWLYRCGLVLITASGVINAVISFSFFLLLVTHLVMFGYSSIVPMLGVFTIIFAAASYWQIQDVHRFRKAACIGL